MRTFAFFSVLCALLFLLGCVQAVDIQDIQGKNDIEPRAGMVQPQVTHIHANSQTAATAETASATDTADTTQTDADTTQTGTEKQTGTNTASKTASSSTSIDPRMGAGGVSMLTPTQGATSYYKIGENVTFGWKYTSLAVTPSAINVVASCSMNEGTYTISSNMSVQETGKAIWDTSDYQANATVPLLTATYTLYIYDAAKEMGDTASAGHLGSLNQFTFGMYVPKSYTPLDGIFSCPILFQTPPVYRIMLIDRIHLRNLQQRHV